MNALKNSTLKNTLRLALSLACLGLMGNGSCGEPLLEDGLFEAWCGDKLCEWDVDEGSVERTPTWHKDDFGVALLGDTTTLSQRSEKQFDCYHVELLSDIDPDTQVLLEMDFEDDGTVEYSQPIDGRNWKQLEFLITPPATYESVRIRVRKLLPGRAVLGRVSITKGVDCAAEPVSSGT